VNCEKRIGVVRDCRKNLEYSYHQVQVRTQPENDVRFSLRIYAFTIFAEILTRGRSQLSSDPRDKIYGLLAMVPDVVGQHIEPRYDLSIHEILTQTALSIIMETGSLFILSQAVQRLWPSELATAGLLSWVPDWSARPEWTGSHEQIKHRINEERLFNACGQSKATTSRCKVGVLRVPGVYIDEIAGPKMYSSLEATLATSVRKC
jgi:hypothetical protein